MKSFSHQRPIRSESGEITGSKPSPVRARTVETLGKMFGPDHDKRLVVTLEAGDLITCRPEKTGRSESIPAKELYCYLLQCKANHAQLARARERKEAKAIRLAAQRQARALKVYWFDRKTSDLITEMTEQLRKERGQE